MKGFLDNSILDPEWREPGEWPPDPYRYFGEGDRVAVVSRPYFNKPGRVRRMASLFPTTYEVVLDHTGDVIRVQPGDMVFLYSDGEFALKYRIFGLDYANMKAASFFARKGRLAKKHGGRVKVLTRFGTWKSDGITTADLSSARPSIPIMGWLMVDHEHINCMMCLNTDEVTVVTNRVVADILKRVGNFYKGWALKDAADFMNDPNRQVCWSVYGNVAYYVPRKRTQEPQKRVLGDT